MAETKNPYSGVTNTYGLTPTARSPYTSSSSGGGGNSPAPVSGGSTTSGGGGGSPSSQSSSSQAYQSTSERDALMKSQGYTVVNGQWVKPDETGRGQIQAPLQNELGAAYIVRGAQESNILQPGSLSFTPGASQTEKELVTQRLKEEGFMVRQSGGQLVNAGVGGMIAQQSQPQQSNMSSSPSGNYGLGSRADPFSNLKAKQETGSLSSPGVDWSNPSEARQAVMRPQNTGITSKDVSSGSWADLSYKPNEETLFGKQYTKPISDWASSQQNPVIKFGALGVSYLASTTEEGIKVLGSPGALGGITAKVVVADFMGNNPNVTKGINVLTSSGALGVTGQAIQASGITHPMTPELRRAAVGEAMPVIQRIGYFPEVFAFTGASTPLKPLEGGLATIAKSSIKTSAVTTGLQVGIEGMSGFKEGSMERIEGAMSGGLILGAGLSYYQVQLGKQGVLYEGAKPAHFGEYKSTATSYAGENIKNTFKVGDTYYSEFPSFGTSKAQINPFGYSQPSQTMPISNLPSVTSNLPSVTSNLPSLSANLPSLSAFGLATFSTGAITPFVGRLPAIAENFMVRTNQNEIMPTTKNFNDITPFQSKLPVIPETGGLINTPQPWLPDTIVTGKRLPTVGEGEGLPANIEENIPPPLEKPFVISFPELPSAPLPPLVMPMFPSFGSGGGSGGSSSKAGKMKAFGAQSRSLPEIAMSYKTSGWFKRGKR